MLISVKAGRFQKYITFFRMRFIGGLQYRAAALAGVVTQFAWGSLELLVYRALYEMSPEAFPMSIKELSAYIWLRQALLTLFMPWYYDNDIFASIRDGSIAYELSRPVNIYYMWFIRAMAGRLSRMILRCLPIVVVAVFVPEPYGLRLPKDVFCALCFLVTAFVGLVVVVAFSMLIYISAFYTVSTDGLRYLFSPVIEFMAGSLIPIPFMPEGVKRIVEILPFASMQDIPLRVYSGNMAGRELLIKAGLQLFWAVALIIIGRLWVHFAIKRVVVQGG